MRRLVACSMAALLVTTTITPGPAFARMADLPAGTTAGYRTDTVQGPDAAAKWKEDAQRIPLGKTIKIKTVFGETLKGVLRTAGDTSVTVEQTSANSVRSVEVAYAEIQTLERQRTGWVSIVAAIGVVAVAAIVFIAEAIGCAGC